MSHAAPCLPSSQTHRLCYFPRAKNSEGTPADPIDDRQSIEQLKGVPRGAHVPVPHFVADEVEELREFIRFLYPKMGQDRFRLHRPDILEPRWTVYAKDSPEASLFYAGGETPLLAVAAARMRLTHEREGERTLTPFSLPETIQEPQTHAD